MYYDMLPSDHVAVETLDDYLAQQAYDRIDHLEAVLKAVADLLEANKSSENVEKAIAFIRRELAGLEEHEEPEHNWEIEAHEARYVNPDFDDIPDPMQEEAETEE